MVCSVWWKLFSNFSTFDWSIIFWKFFRRKQVSRVAFLSYLSSPPSNTPHLHPHPRSLHFMSSCSCYWCFFSPSHFNLQVFISWALSQKVSAIFECVRKGKEKDFRRKRGRKIEYESLALGKLLEVRHIFAMVVFDTVFPPHLKD